MKRSYFWLFALLAAVSANAQTITIPDAAFKAKLLESDPGNFIARNLGGDYFAIDSNSNGEIEVGEALELGYLDVSAAAIASLEGIEHFTNLVYLQCENNQLANLNVSMLAYLTNLDCSDNQLASLNLSGLTELQFLDCQFNQLSQLNADGITQLLDLNCSYNSITALGLNVLEHLETLNCSNNLLTSVSFTDLIYLETLDCSYNQLTTLDTTGLTSLESLNCSSNWLASLTVNGLINFRTLDCSNNQQVSLNLIGLPYLENLNCSSNQLSLINLNNLTSLKSLNCINNQLGSLNLDGLTQLLHVYCSNNQVSALGLEGLTQLITLETNNNQISVLDLDDLGALKYLYCNANLLTVLNPIGLDALLALSCSDNQLTTLNLNGNRHLQSLYCSNNQLTSLFIKNGSNETNLQFSGNPNLAYVCADGFETEYVQDEINANNYTDCHVNTYCSFVPGGVSYSISGNVGFDANNNGCNAADGSYPNLELAFWDGSENENLIADASGNFDKSVRSGSYTVSPILENPGYFSVSPSTFTVDFTQTPIPYHQDFCITPNGSHNDIEVVLLPLGDIVPGLDSSYKLLYKNKGTTTQSGTISLNFNDAVLDVVQSIPTVSMQSGNNLMWAFSGLQPLETRSVVLILNANSATEIPALTSGQVMSFTASASTSAADETPADNTSAIRQTVVNSGPENNKTCLEGATVTTAQAGAYAHYVIRFENTGSAVAQNVVVKDIVDTSKFDPATLRPLDGSHPFETRISGNRVEFVFMNSGIDPGSGGYLAFKIKTLPTLVVGDSFSNTASVYFDYAAPVFTNTETTVIQALTGQEFGTIAGLHIYPNPVNNLLHIATENQTEIKTASIYNALGQLLQVTANPVNATLDASRLPTGTYFLHLDTAQGTSIVKFLKE